MKVSRLIFYSAFSFLLNTNCLKRLKSMQTCILFSILLSQAFQKPENILVLKLKTKFPATRTDGGQNRRRESRSASTERKKETRCCFSVFCLPHSSLVPPSEPDTAAALPLSSQPGSGRLRAAPAPAPALPRDSRGEAAGPQARPSRRGSGSPLFN